MSSISGFTELEKKLAALPQNIENKVLQKAVSAAMREGLKNVRAAAPRDAKGQSPSSKKYGRLYKNIKSKVSKRDKDRGQRGAYITTGNSFWGFMLEKGTRYISARPWFLPAFSRSKEQIIRVLAQKLGEGIEKEASK